MLIILLRFNESSKKAELRRPHPSIYMMAACTLPLQTVIVHLSSFEMANIIINRRSLFVVLSAKTKTFLRADKRYKISRRTEK